MPIPFRYAPEIRARFPHLRTAALVVDGVSSDPNHSGEVVRLQKIAGARLANGPESEFEEIQAWRRAFSAMGLKPTQYRCASEALLRRYRKEGTLPALHPLIDLCNAISIAFAIPVAVFDISKVTGTMTVRSAEGNEVYETFAGQIEHPEPGEITFADDNGTAHARRWTNRQSGWSAIGPKTAKALIVAEALHQSASQDLTALNSWLAGAFHMAWPNCQTESLTPS